MVCVAGRTFPTHRLYVGETKEKVSLFRVLIMYAKFNTSVGYCQGEQLMITYLGMCVVVFSSNHKVYICHSPINTLVQKKVS